MRTQHSPLVCRGGRRGRGGEGACQLGSKNTGLRGHLAATPHQGFEDRASLVAPKLAVISSPWFLFFSSCHQSQVPKASLGRAGELAVPPAGNEWAQAASSGWAGGERQLCGRASQKHAFLSGVAEGCVSILASASVPHGFKSHPHLLSSLGPVSLPVRQG